MRSRPARGLRKQALKGEHRLNGTGGALKQALPISHGLTASHCQHTLWPGQGTQEMGHLKVLWGNKFGLFPTPKSIFQPTDPTDPIGCRGIHRHKATVARAKGGSGESTACFGDIYNS